MRTWTVCPFTIIAIIVALSSAAPAVIVEGDMASFYVEDGQKWFWGKFDARLRTDKNGKVVGNPVLGVLKGDLTDKAVFLGTEPGKVVLSVTVPRKIRDKAVIAVGDRAFKEDKTLKTVRIPSTVQMLGVESFCLCTELDSLDLPESVVSIQDQCLAGTGLKVFPIPASGNPVYLGVGVFAYNRFMTEVSLPRRITDIPERTFENCWNLSKVVFDGQETIGPKAFLECRRLENLKIPSSIRRIDQEAFSGCTSLTSVEFEETNYEVDLGEDSFAWCSQLNHVSLSVGVVRKLLRTQNSPFSECKSLEVIEIPESLSDEDFSFLAPTAKCKIVPKRQSKTIQITKTISLELIPVSNVLLFGKYEVTQSQWKAIMGRDPPLEPNNFGRYPAKGPDNPVEQVSWNDCQNFLKKVNTLPSVMNSGFEFRLPTEEEWKVACRAGATGDYCLLQDGTEITKDTVGQVAWNLMVKFSDEDSPERMLDQWARRMATAKSHPVGQKQPNAFGLYDMLGNVSEWTSTSTADGKEYIICGSAYDSSPEPKHEKRSLLPLSKVQGLGFRLCADRNPDTLLDSFDNNTFKQQGEDLKSEAVVDVLVKPKTSTSKVVPDVGSGSERNTTTKHRSLLLSNPEFEELAQKLSGISECPTYDKLISIEKTWSSLAESSKGLFGDLVPSIVCAGFLSQGHVAASKRRKNQLSAWSSLWEACSQPCSKCNGYGKAASLGNPEKKVECSQCYGEGRFVDQEKALNHMKKLIRRMQTMEVGPDR